MCSCYTYILAVWVVTIQGHFPDLTKQTSKRVHLPQCKIVQFVHSLKTVDNMACIRNINYCVITTIPPLTVPPGEYVQKLQTEPLLPAKPTSLAVNYTTLPNVYPAFVGEGQTNWILNLVNKKGAIP